MRHKQGDAALSLNYIRFIHALFFLKHDHDHGTPMRSAMLACLYSSRARRVS